MPEASLAGIAVGFALERVRPWRIGRRPAGWSLVAAGGLVIAGSLRAARTTDLSSPDRLVTSGPYALSRNPMYVGWALMQLGIGLITGSGWVLATLPAVGAGLHRDVVREERRLQESFGDEYERYSERVGRYLPRR
ncbi:isoprenylcysteine carboxylmethyltransferase family protein [Kribbella soli]|uniref:Isoprenylcysteine carboxylmethyltransferase family protein n=1 Tax=Kribbella soli TaxID=1124743 RepID=A0A4R0HWZ8_9ACTN|nr:isoprenylcysteine carboxylmethyltransferase family protein [Kribbella soli]